MVVTSNIELERMLLHSCASSTVKPGMVSRTPSWATGTATAAKSMDAADADPCCNRPTNAFMAS